MISRTSQSNIDHQLDQDDDHDYWVGVHVGQLDLGAQSGGNSGKSRGTHTDRDIQNKHIICIIIGNIIRTIRDHIVQMSFYHNFDQNFAKISLVQALMINGILLKKS